MVDWNEGYMDKAGPAEQVVDTTEIFRSTFQPENIYIFLLIVKGNSYYWYKLFE